MQSNASQHSENPKKKACINKLAFLGLAFFFTNYDLGYRDMILLEYLAGALNLSPDNINSSARRDSKTKN